jgi:hypothetical protein
MICSTLRLNKATQRDVFQDHRDTSERIYLADSPHIITKMRWYAISCGIRAVPGMHAVRCISTCECEHGGYARVVHVSINTPSSLAVK